MSITNEKKSGSTKAPLMSCVVTIFNEGNLASVSIKSLLSQSFPDFEIVIVDDGASEKTRQVVQAYDDPRIKYIRQTNDGLSSARNRGLQHCSGEYICFLDADDTRPVWAFDLIAKEINKNSPEAIFTAGSLSDVRGDILPFYDQRQFTELEEICPDGHFDTNSVEFKKGLPLLFHVEPQSANKIVKRSLIKERSLSFPNTHFFEDMLFHTGVVANVKSFSIINEPLFVYYRRYGRPQITGAVSDMRFDAISVAKITLEYFSNAPRYSNVEARKALLLSMFKLVKWCEDSISHIHKYQFSEMVSYVVMSIDEGYMSAIKEVPDNNIVRYIKGKQLGLGDE